MRNLSDNCYKVFGALINSAGASGVVSTPASKNAKLTQRIRKVKSNHWYLEIVFTFDDPTYYTRPWS